MDYKPAALLADAVSSALVGKREAAELAVIALLAGGHLLIEDVPGVGKTTLALAIASAAGCSFGRLQFTPDTMPSDVFGVSIYNSKTGQFEYKQGPVMKNVILADEINRTPPKTQSALLEAMQENQVTVDGVSYPLPEPFFVVATQNPVEQYGTYPLPEAQLDRFMMRISIGYPDRQSEESLIARALDGKAGTVPDKVMDAPTLVSLRRDVRQVDMCPEIRSYIAELAALTRENDRLSLGASPRAAIAIAYASQAAAFLADRDYVTPDDVKKVFVPVTAHRVMVSPKARAEGYNAEGIITRVMKSVKVPAIM